MNWISDIRLLRGGGEYGDGRSASRCGVFFTCLKSRCPRLRISGHGRCIADLRGIRQDRSGDHRPDRCSGGLRIRLLERTSSPASGASSSTGWFVSGGHRLGRCGRLAGDDSGIEALEVVRHPAQPQDITEQEEVCVAGLRDLSGYRCGCILAGVFPLAGSVTSMAWLPLR